MSQDHAVQTFLTRHRRLWILLPLLVLLFIILLLAFILPRSPNNRSLKPIRPSRTPGEASLTGQAAILTFTDLNEAPDSYRNQRIRVTGDYQALPPPECRPYSGRIFSWSLVAEELQLNAAGFESLLRNVPDGTTLTVEGIWRLYDGPLGCGKEPPDGIAWYLAVERIVSPNPLPNFGRTPRPTGAPGDSPDVLTTPPPDGSLTPTATETPPEVIFTPLATPTLNLGGTAVGTTIPTIIATPGPGTVFPSVTPLVSATPTNFPPGFASPTPASGSPTPTVTAPPLGTIPPISTAPPQPTSPAYPGTTVTPTPTATPNPY